MTGTGKYRTLEKCSKHCPQRLPDCHRCRAPGTDKGTGTRGLAEALGQNWMLPNTAGCQTAEEAIRVARLGREIARLLGGEDNFVKLEVIPDPAT